jgi:cytochrome P450
MTDQLDHATSPEDADADAELAAAFMSIWGDPEMSSCPQRVHRRLREQGDAVRMGPMVMLTTRPAVEEALRRTDVLSSGMAASRLGNTRPLIPMQLDPPDHARYRRLLEPLFAPRQIARLEADITELVVSRVEHCAGQAVCDFTEDLAVPVPAAVFARMMGLPKADLGDLIAWKDAIVHPDWGDPGEVERLQDRAGQSIYRYFDEILAAKAARPADDLPSTLLAVDGAGGKLTTDEIVDICYLLLLAGLDTVTDTLTLTFAHLARTPEAQRAIVAEPAIIPAVVEEMLRWESPVPGVPRLVTGEAEIAGCPVHPGDLVYVSFGAANTDEGALPDAHTIRFDREGPRHLAFGGGIHRCVGAHLARVQVRSVLAEWHTRIPSYHIPDGVELAYRPGLRSVDHLPLEITLDEPR